MTGKCEDHEVLWWERVDGLGRGGEPRGPSPAAQDDTPSEEGGRGKGEGKGEGEGKGNSKCNGKCNSKCNGNSNSKGKSQCGDSSLRSE